MAYQQRKVLLFCYLLMSSLLISMAQKVEVTDDLVNEVTDDFMKEFDQNLDLIYKKAPVNPDNAIDEEDRSRAFFLIPFLPKLAILLVKVAIKLAPLIIKAAVAVKAKAAVVAAAGLAKVSTAAALKATAISVGKAILVDTVTTAVIDVVVDKISDAVSPPPPPPSEDVLHKEHKLNLVGLYEMDSEECTCWKKKYCSCCVKPEEFEAGCFNLTLGDTLWNEKSNIRVGAFYGGKEIMTRKMKVGRPCQKCQLLQAPFNTTNMCVSSWGRTFRGERVIQCFSVHFNRRGINKCIVQNKKNKLWFKAN